MQACLKRQVSEGWNGAVCFGIDEAYNMLKGVIDDIVEGINSSSALLLGASGTGKTMALNRILDEQREELLDPDHLVVIELSGLLHNEPRIACEEILFQITGEIPNVSSFDEAGEIVQETLKKAEESFIIILDNLDLFATLQRAKQSLLYFLFDLIHQSDINLGVIGTTTRLDCISLLEKRVISRFSQIQIHFYPPDKLIQYLLFIQQRLLISDESIKQYNLSSEKVYQYNDGIRVSIFIEFWMYINLFILIHLLENVKRRCINN